MVYSEPQTLPRYVREHARAEGHHAQVQTDMGTSGFQNSRTGAAHAKVKGSKGTKEGADGWQILRPSPCSPSELGKLSLRSRTRTLRLSIKSTPRNVGSDR